MAGASSVVNYSYSVILADGPPWGIRLQGGHEFAQKLRVAKVNPNSKAYRQGIQTGDLIDTINGVGTDGMNHRDALRLFQNSNGKLVLELTRTEKQSAIPILRVESPADIGPLESDLDGADSSEYLYDDICATGQSMASGNDDLYLASEPEMTSHHQTYSAWSQNGPSQKKVYHPVPFGTRANNSAAPSKGYESADEILISKSFAIPVKIQESSHPSRRRRHPRHLSDPGFDSKQSLRPPISDVIQLSRRSRQFNFWNHFYPRDFSDPGVLAPTADPEGSSSSVPNSLARPPVFTSVEEFQRHYGLCYARTLPLRKRYTTRPAVIQNGTPSNPQTKRVQFAADEPQDEQPPFYDSDDAVAATLPRVTHPRRKTIASLLPPDKSRTRPQNENPNPYPIVGNSLITKSTPSSLPGQSDNLDSVTSSLKISLSSSLNIDETENKAKICNQKFLKGKDSAANKVVNSNSSRVTAGDYDDDDDDYGALTSTEFELPLETVGTATARFDFDQSELPPSQNQTLTLLIKNLADATCALAQPQTVPLTDQQKVASEPVKFKAIHDQSNPKASRSNITSIQTTARATTKPSGSSASFADQDLLDLMGDLSGNTCNSHLDEKNNEKSTSCGIIESSPCGIRYASRTDRTKYPSTVSKLSTDATECFRSTLPATTFQNKVNKQEKISTTDRMLSPRLSDPNLVRDRNSQYFNDEYWLELAGLGNACIRSDHSSVGHSKISTALSKISSASKAIALYSFKAKSEKELSFTRGDRISILRPIDKNWYEGELNAAVGLVPCSYVKITNDLDEKQEMEKQEKALVKVKAKHDFMAKFPTELSFNSGDVLTVIRRIDGNWYEGRLKQRTGIFPVSYVEPLKESSLPSTHQTAILSGSSALSPSSPAVPFAETRSRDAPRDTPRYTHKDTLNGLSRDVLEFDKLFENYGNLSTTKNDQKTFVNNNEQLLTLPSAKRTRTPVDSKFSTISVSSSIRNDSLSSDAVRNPHSVQQKIQSEPSAGSVNRSATPSLHLLYEEPWYQVLYDYSPEHDDELDLCEGDLIYLLERCDDGWCVGRSDRTKRIGTFPGNYVKQLG